MDRFFRFIARYYSKIVYQAILACIFIGIYAVVRIYVLDIDADASMLESILILFGSVILSDIIVKKIAEKIK